MLKKEVKLAAIVLVIGLLFSIATGSKVAYADDFMPKVDKIMQEYESIYEGDTQTLDVLIKGRDKIQYRVWLNNKTTGAWMDITNGFTGSVDSNRVYSITTPKLTQGEYTISVWVKRAGQTPKDKRGFDSYATTNIKCLKSDGQTSNINIGEFKNNYAIGDTVQVKKVAGKQYLYKYNVVNAINNKELVPFKDYVDSLTWKTTTGQGLYLMQINVRYTERVEVPKPNKENNTSDKIVKEESTETNGTVNKEENTGLNNNQTVKEETDSSIIDQSSDNDITSNEEEIEYKEIQKDVKITKLIMVGDPFKYVGPTAPSISSLVVGNVGQGSIVYIKAQASANSKNVGYIYGSLHGVKILKQVGKFYYIEATDYVSLNLVRGYVYTWQLKTVKPTGTYSLLVDLSDQRVYVFKAKELIKTIICSTGLDATPTPPGTYLVGDRGSYFYTGYNNSTICYNWVRINNDFLFHSVLFNTKGQVYESEAAKLGTKASHGCIRVPLEDSKWIYNTIPQGTLVVIQN